MPPVGDTVAGAAAAGPVVAGAAAAAAVIGARVRALWPALLSAARSPRRTITAVTPTAMAPAMAMAMAPAMATAPAIPTDPAARGGGWGMVTVGFAAAVNSH